MPTVLITGGHAGIGFECAKRLSSQAQVDLILAGRSLERVEPAARQLRSTFGVKVEALLLDVSSLASVRAAAARCGALLDAAEESTLQALLFNAGAQFHGPVSYSPDGYEETFATNCLGHFLLLELLFDRLAADGRVVFTASGTHDPETADGRLVGAAAAPDAKVLAFEGKDGRKPLSASKRYTTSKLCTMLYAYELHRRLRRAGNQVASIAYDPGWIPETGLIRTMPKPVRWLSQTSIMRWGMRRMGITKGSLGFSGAALADLAIDPLYAEGSGKYYQSSDGRLIEARSSRVSYDEQMAVNLWEDSRLLVNLKPDEEPAPLK